jgi:hypothetical protein
MRSGENTNLSSDNPDGGNVSGGGEKKEVKIEEHAIVVGWYNEVTIVSGGTDEMIYFWEIGKYLLLLWIL